MTTVARADRISGAIMGALVGDALGLGPHWYTSRPALIADYGWIEDYVAPLPNRYHAGLQAGEVSQTGQITILLLESVAECGAYDAADFTRRLDGLLATLDGSPWAGRYTDSAMRHVWHARQAGLDWSEAGSFHDTAEAAIRSPVLATRYVNDIEQAMENIIADVRLTHRDPFIVGQATAFGLNICALVNGVPLAKVRSVLMAIGSPSGEESSVITGDMPERKPTSVPEQWVNAGLNYTIPVTWLGTQTDTSAQTSVPKAPFFDSLIQHHDGYLAAKDPAITIEPAEAINDLLGLHCTMGMLLPAAYYFVGRYEDDFEMAVLSAVNAAGNNMACAALTGALSGAIVGLSGIPERFISGLADHERLLRLAERIALATETSG